MTQNAYECYLLDELVNREEKKNVIHILTKRSKYSFNAFHSFGRGMCERVRERGWITCLNVIVIMGNFEILEVLNDITKMHDQLYEQLLYNS